MPNPKKVKKCDKEKKGGWLQGTGDSTQSTTNLQSIVPGGVDDQTRADVTGKMPEINLTMRDVMNSGTSSAHVPSNASHPEHMGEFEPPIDLSNPQLLPSMTGGLNMPGVTSRKLNRMLKKKGESIMKDPKNLPNMSRDVRNAVQSVLNAK